MCGAYQGILNKLPEIQTFSYSIEYLHAMELCRRDEGMIYMIRGVYLSSTLRSLLPNCRQIM